MSLPDRFVWSLTFTTPYIFWSIHDSSTLCQNIMGCLKSCSEMPCSGTSPTLKIERHSQKFNIYMSFGLKTIIIYWPSINNFIYAITFNIFWNTTKRKELYTLKRTTFAYVLSSDWWISDLSPISCWNYLSMNIIQKTFFVLNIYNTCA